MGFKILKVCSMTKKDATFGISIVLRNVKRTCEKENDVAPTFVFKNFETDRSDIIAKRKNVKTAKHFTEE